MHRRYLALAALSVFASAIIPSVSQAQFGKLKKAATSAASAAGVNTTPPRYVDNIDVTSAQLKQVNTGLAAEIAATPGAVKNAEAQQKNAEKAEEQYKKDSDAYDKASEKYEACKAKVIKDAEPSRTAAQQKAESAEQGANVNESEQASIEAQAKAAQAAAERVQNGTATAADRQTLADFQKTMSGVSARTMSAASAAGEASSVDQAVIAKVEKTCGTKPVSPTAPKSAANTAADVIQDAGAQAAGMPIATWKVIREKAEGYAASNTQVKAGKIPQEEADAINSELAITRQKMAEMQKAGTPM